MHDIFNQIANVIKPTNMHSKILQQKQLMEQALEILHQIKTIEFMFSDFDKEYCDKKVDELQNQYVEIMSELRGNLLSIAA